MMNGPTTASADRIVADVMSTDLLTLKLNDTLRLADDMLNLAQVRHFPVLDGDRVRFVAPAPRVAPGQIVALYDLLYAAAPTPIVALNRAIAVGEVDGPEVALRTAASHRGLVRVSPSVGRLTSDQMGMGLT